MDRPHRAAYLPLLLLSFTAGALLASCSKKDKEAPATNNRYISKVYAYVPAPGQFINDSTWSTPGAIASITGGTEGHLCLGAYGGYVIFGFDHAVQNSDGADLAIYGNPVQPPTEWSEPGIVMVSRDANGNGLPDDEWYELAGSEYNNATTVKNYTITYYNPKTRADIAWKDNKGGAGVVEINNFHGQSNFYPLFIAAQDSVSFTGTLLKTTFTIQPPSLYTSVAYTRGYADSWSTGDNYATNRFNSLDIAWAVNSNGTAVNLPEIHFVKVYTGVNDKGSKQTGEISTEIAGAADMHMP